MLEKVTDQLLQNYLHLNINKNVMGRTILLCINKIKNLLNHHFIKKYYL